MFTIEIEPSLEKIPEICVEPKNYNIHLNCNTWWGRIKNWFILWRHFSDIYLGDMCVFANPFDQYLNKNSNKGCLTIKGALTEKQLIWLGRRLKKSKNEFAIGVYLFDLFTPSTGYNYLKTIYRHWPPFIYLKVLPDMKVFLWKEYNLYIKGSSQLASILDQSDEDFYAFLYITEYVFIYHLLIRQMELARKLILNTLINSKSYNQSDYITYLDFLNKAWLSLEEQLATLKLQTLAGQSVNFLEGESIWKDYKKYFKETLAYCYGILHRYGVSRSEPVEKEKLCLSFLNISIDQWQACSENKEKRENCINTAYRKKSLTCHPDKKTGTNRKFQLLGLVKEFLLSEEQSPINEGLFEELINSVDLSNKKKENETLMDLFKVKTSFKEFEVFKEVYFFFLERQEQKQVHLLIKQKKKMLFFWRQWLQYHYPTGEERNRLLSAYNAERENLINEDIQALEKDAEIFRFHITQEYYDWIKETIRVSIPDIEQCYSPEKRIAEAKTLLIDYGKQSAYWYYPKFLGGKSIATYVRERNYMMDFRKERQSGKKSHQRLSIYGRLSKLLDNVTINHEQGSIDIDKVGLQRLSREIADIQGTLLNPDNDKLMHILHRLKELFPVPDGDLDETFSAKAENILTNQSFEINDTTYQWVKNKSEQENNIDNSLRFGMFVPSDLSKCDETLNRNSEKNIKNNL